MPWETRRPDAAENDTYILRTDSSTAGVPLPQPLSNVPGARWAHGTVLGVRYPVLRHTWVSPKGREQGLLGTEHWDSNGPLCPETLLS